MKSVLGGSSHSFLLVFNSPLQRRQLDDLVTAATPSETIPFRKTRRFPVASRVTSEQGDAHTSSPPHHHHEEGEQPAADVAWLHRKPALGPGWRKEPGFATSRGK